MTDQEESSQPFKVFSTGCPDTQTITETRYSYTAYDKNAALNTGIQVFVWIYVFPKSGLLYVYPFDELSACFPETEPFYIPLSSVCGWYPILNNTG